MAKIDPTRVDVGDRIVVGGIDFFVAKALPAMFMDELIVVMHLLRATSLDEVDPLIATVTWPVNIPIEIH